MDMAGGSERRCLELANGIAFNSEHRVFLLAEKKIPDKIKIEVRHDVTMIENSLAEPDYFYNSDCIIVVNTDCRDFTTEDYWLGKSDRHDYSIDLNKLSDKKMFFVFNFIVSPSRHLYQLSKYDIDIHILPTNMKFFNEISKQDRYDKVRILPRYTLNSPINPDSVNSFIRNPKDKICFGMHSKRLGNKWNDEIEKLIKDINKRYSKDQVEFRFMGTKNDLRKKLDKIDNVVCLKEDKETVRDFLSKLDVFLFFPDWKREEPWARVIAEAMVSGCPVIALDKGGTCDQVLKYNNGFLCKKYNDYYHYVVYLIEHREMIPIMSKNSLRISKDFHSDKVIKRLISIMEN